MKKIPYFDVQQHLRDWRHYVLPIFVTVAAVALVAFLVVRLRKSEMPEPWRAEPARIGLLAPGKEALFDPAFAVTTPVEMVLAPTADTFDYPVGSRHGALTYNAQPFFTNQHLGDDLNGIGGWNSDLGDPVYAIADGRVVFSGRPSEGWGNVVTLQHELENGRLVQSFYGHLDSIRVPVGERVRRGDRIGSIGTADGRYLAHLHFELRRYPSLDVGAGYAESRLGRLPGELMMRKWRRRDEDRLAPPPRGAPLEPNAFQVDQVDAPEESPPER